MNEFRPVLRWAFPQTVPVIYDRASFPMLFLAHLALVATASAAAATVGVALAVFVTRPAGAPFRVTVGTLVAIGQTFPPVAVLAIAVPLIGFGARPTIIALFLYGLLPIVENGIAGLEGVPADVREAATAWACRRYSGCSRSSCRSPHRSSLPGSAFRSRLPSAPLLSARRSAP